MVKATKPTPTTQRRLLKYEEVGEILGVSARHVRRLVASREIPVVKISSRVVRIEEADVYTYIKRAKVAANGRRWDT